MRYEDLERAARRARPGPRLRAGALLFMAAVLVLPGLVAAQSVLGVVRGTVTDPQGLPLPGVTVQVTDQATALGRTVTTDADGNYECLSLRPGTYSVVATLSGFSKTERKGVIVRSSAASRADIRLEIRQQQETVEVTGEAQNAITLESQAINSGLDAQQLRDLPRDSRDIQSFLLLNPNVVGTNDAPQFLGGRTYGAQYIQDGQTSTGAIFGEIANSAPGLDAIAEMTVLSNSYSAEYGGLAGFVVTTKRGGNQYRGSAFYDFNSDELNALTYAQKEAGDVRGDPNADSSQHRFGASFGGPIVKGKTFFFANYEGLRDKAIYGAARATVPTAAMRAGDFSGASFKIKDPLTGQPFPGNIIPAGRLDPSALKIQDFAYPLPNQGTLSNGFGQFQEFQPYTRNRHRADLRIDHELTSRDTLFVRGSYQNRNPSSIIFESSQGLTNLGVLNSAVKTATAIAGWTRIYSNSVVNELRVGYNFDESGRSSQYNASALTSQWGIEIPEIAQNTLGFPGMLWAGTNRPTEIRDQRANVDRVLRQNSFSISDNVSWVKGSHSLKFGGLFTRNVARDGYSAGSNFGKGQYRFDSTNPRGTGNGYADFLLGLPLRVEAQTNNRLGIPLQATSNDFAVFAQDDWRVNPNLTVFLGLRYEVVGVFVDDNDLFANFRPVDDGHHFTPTTEVANTLPPGAVALGRTLLAEDYGVGRGLMNTDWNNFSPRVGFAWRPSGDDKTVVRGGFGLFHPTGAAQGARDIMSRNPFRYSRRYVGGGLQNGFSGGTEIVFQSFGNQGLDPNLQQPDIYQYNLTFERELPGQMGLRLSYLGSTMRKLLVNPDYNTVQASDVFLGDPAEDPEALARFPFPLYGTYMDITQNTGSGQFHAGQLELQRRYSNGLAFNVAYTLATTDSNAPDSGNSTIGVVQYDPYDIEKDRGPDPFVVKHRLLVNATWDLPVGKKRRFGSNMPGWADVLFGGWTVSTIFQARTGPHLTPHFIYYTSPIYPANTGRGLDGVGDFGERWRPDLIGDPASGGPRSAFFDQTAFGIPPDGSLGSVKRGSVDGPGTWIVNFGIYKDLVATDRFRLQFTATMNNAFNHPQFFVGWGTNYDSGFMDLTDYLLNGIDDNGVTGVLGGGVLDNVEGFSPGRVVRFGIRATF